MNRYRITCSLLFALAVLSPSAWAAGPKPCAELKSEIASKIDARGVKDYSLEIVAPDAVGDARVVGSCEGGTQRITYRRAPLAASAVVASKDATVAKVD